MCKGRFVDRVRLETLLPYLYNAIFLRTRWDRSMVSAMQIRLVCNVALLALMMSPAAGNGASPKPMMGDASTLTTEQASGGLKEALSRGVTTAVAETGKPGGFENNPLIKITMPEKLRTVEKGLRAIEMGAKVDEFEHSMNAAAEEAAPAAKSIFMDALKATSFADAKQIVMGGNTAGTDYFKRTTSTQVSEALSPSPKGRWRRPA